MYSTYFPVWVPVQKVSPFFVCCCLVGVVLFPFWRWWTGPPPARQQNHCEVLRRTAAYAQAFVSEGSPWGVVPVVGYPCRCPSATPFCKWFCLVHQPFPELSLPSYNGTCAWSLGSPGSVRTTLNINEDIWSLRLYCVVGLAQTRGLFPNGQHATPGGPTTTHSKSKPITISSHLESKYSPTDQAGSRYPVGRTWKHHTKLGDQCCLSKIPGRTSWTLHQQRCLWFPAYGSAITAFPEADAWPCSNSCHVEV